MDEIDRKTGQSTLREGLAAALGGESGCVRGASLDALAAVLSAAYDRAAGAIAAGESADDYRGALRILVEGLSGSDTDRS